MSDSQLVILSPLHAAMQVIRDFTDPDTMILGRPKKGGQGKSYAGAKREQWLYERLLAVHQLAGDSIKRDEIAVGDTIPSE